MKWLIKLVWLSVLAYSIKAYTADDYDGYPHSAKSRRDFAIDSTIRQLDYEYAKANSAISVNDAEKVYLQRFENDLLNKREAVCKQEMNRQSCNY